MNADQLGIASPTGVCLDGRTVCIVDDDELYRARLGVMLAQNKLRVFGVGDSDGLMASIGTRMPDCILLDYNLEHESGLHLHELLRARFPDLAPVVMLTADESQRAIIRAFRSGIDDYLLKRSLRIDELIASIRGAIARHDEALARNEEIARLRARSDFDDLTGTYTRRVLEEKLAVIAEGRGDRPFALTGIVFHLYHPICERFGIVAADRILRVVATRLRSAVRPSDILGRYGRDTFLHVVDTDASPGVLDELRARLTRAASFAHQLDAAQLDLSVATATVRYPDDHDAVPRLLERLDGELARIRMAAEAASSGSRDWAVVPEPEATAAGAAAEGRDRRRQPRWRTLKPGKIVLNGYHSTIDCTVRNMSEGGARLRIEGPIAIPEFFHLKVTEAGALRRVRKCWHINNDLGVQFLPG